MLVRDIARDIVIFYANQNLRPLFEGLSKILPFQPAPFAVLQSASGTRFFGMTSIFKYLLLMVIAIVRCMPGYKVSTTLSRVEFRGTIFTIYRLDPKATHFDSLWNTGTKNRLTAPNREREPTIYRIMFMVKCS